MKPTVVYLHVLGGSKYTLNTAHFLESYRRFPPGCDHDTVIVFTNGTPTDVDRKMFAHMPGVSFFQHDNEGWDIGAFISVSKTLKCELAMYFGGTSYVQRAGWLARMVEASEKHGLGFYGSLSSHEVCPHINTTGFCCHPMFVAAYPIKVSTRRQRADFEHGPNALWRIVAENGFPALLVTWCGEYAVKDWRTPPNIYRRGDQSNCLTYFAHSTAYGLADEYAKRRFEHSADTTLYGWEGKLMDAY